MLELIYKNENGAAHYDAQRKLVKTQYKGIVKVEAITDLLRHVIAYAEKNEIRLMCANLTEMQGTFSGAMDFFENEFYPSMIKNGLRAYAAALSKDVFTKFAASQLQKKVGGKLDWQAFSSIEDAEQWIEKHP
ncbi:hypothetical protein [Pseudochryseolinea flava]|nr:hypothetical protein [Pseudochryseolinea flava]